MTYKRYQRPYFSKNDTHRDKSLHITLHNVYNGSVCDLETIPIFQPHYHTHSDNASRPAADYLPTWCVLAG